MSLLIRSGALFASALLLSACLAKKPAVSAPNPTPTAWAAVFSPAESDAPLSDFPPSTTRVLQALLTERGLILAPSPDPIRLGSRPTLPQRLESMVETSAGAKLLVLLEADARFSAQLEGRMRWNVHIRVTVATAAQPEAAQVAEFDVPVFLQFLHEGELRALEEATPLIARRLGPLLDEAILGMNR
jgi:hypothetical protein